MKNYLIYFFYNFFSNAISSFDCLQADEVVEWFKRHAASKPKIIDTDKQHQVQLDTD